MTVWIINHYAAESPQAWSGRHFFMAKTLIERGYNVRIFAASTVHNANVNYTNSDGRGLFYDVAVEGVNYTYIKSELYKGNGISRVKNMLGFAFRIKKIWKKYRRENPDIIYASTPDIFTAWKAEKFAKKHKLPCVVEVRDLWPLSIVAYKGFSDNNPAIRFLYGLEKKIYKRADALVFTMEGGKDYIRDKKWDKKIDSAKVFHINNGLDVAEQERQKNEYTIDDQDLTDGVFNVVYAGSIRTANSVDLLVKAAEKLKDEAEIRFLIYGDGDRREELEKYCADNGLHNVKCKGKVEKKYIPYICSQASVNVLTYKNAETWKYGGSQNKVFDYMNAGKPIITNIKMGYSLLERYGCGVELGCDSHELLADAIMRIYDMPKEDYDQMCENAKNAAKEYDYGILTDKLEKVLEYAVGKHGE